MAAAAASRVANSCAGPCCATGSEERTHKRVQCHVQQHCPARASAVSLRMVPHEGFVLPLRKEALDVCRNSSVPCHWSLSAPPGSHLCDAWRHDCLPVDCSRYLCSNNIVTALFAGHSHDLCLLPACSPACNLLCFLPHCLLRCLLCCLPQVPARQQHCAPRPQVRQPADGPQEQREDR